MFTLNDLLDQVECQGEVKVLLIEECNEDIREVFHGNDLRQVPYKIACKELVYIYSKDNCTFYEVNE
mgnify:FL=1